jgi:HlyD family secretion protein
LVAVQQVNSAKAQLDLTVNGPTPQEIAAARAAADQAKGTLREARAQLGQLRIYAPESGVVVTKYREVGETVSPGTAIVRIANLDRLWARVYAPLKSLGEVTVGQRAWVRVDLGKGEEVEGSVGSVNSDPEFTPKSVQTSEERVKLVYAVRVLVNNPSHRLKPGMPVDVRFQK